jgi:hypothetical protein
MTAAPVGSSQEKFIGTDVEPWLKSLKERVENSRSRHHGDVVTDQIMYNGGTIVILFATTFATFAPSIITGSTGTGVAQVLTGLATFLVALLRALSFGERWTYNREMESGYNAILDMIDFYALVPPDENRNIWISYGPHCPHFASARAPSLAWVPLLRPRHSAAYLSAKTIAAPMALPGPLHGSQGKGVLALKNLPAAISRARPTGAARFHTTMSLERQRRLLPGTQASCPAPLLQHLPKHARAATPPAMQA